MAVVHAVCAVHSGAAGVSGSMRVGWDFVRWISESGGRDYGDGEDGGAGFVGSGLFDVGGEGDVGWYIVDRRLLEVAGVLHSRFGSLSTWIVVAGAVMLRSVTTATDEEEEEDELCRMLEKKCRV